eukprot:6726932-Karenia_brevis.AAC.1
MAFCPSKDSLDILSVGAIGLKMPEGKMSPRIGKPNTRHDGRARSGHCIKVHSTATVTGKMPSLCLANHGLKDRAHSSRGFKALTKLLSNRHCLDLSLVDAGPSRETQLAANIKSDSSTGG